MVGELLFNLAALVAFCVLPTFLLDPWPLGRTRTLWIQGALFGLIAVAGMAFPVRLESGVIFDGRTVVLCLAAWHFGWRAALLSSLIAILYRLGLGGSGAIIGTIIILCSSGIGLGFRRWVNPELQESGIRHVALLGVAVHAVTLIILTVSFEGEDLRFFTQVMVPPLLSAYPLATVLAGRILSDCQSKTWARRQLTLNESMIRSLFDDSPLVLLILDPDTHRILDANRKAIAYYGYTIEALLSMHLKDLQVARPVGMRETFPVAAAAHEEIHHLRHRLASGEVREVETSSGPVYFEGRNVELMFVVDITQQVQSFADTREALREREAILETAMDGFWIVDDSRVIREVNMAYCSLSGYLPEELIGRNLDRLDCRPDRHHRYYEQGPDGGAGRFETQHRTKDGQILDLEVNVRNNRAEGEERYFVFFRDVTADKAAKAHMVMLSACLAAAENTVVISDPEQRIEWVNDAFCRISGYRKDEAYGKTTEEIFQPGKESRTAADSMFQARKKGTPWRGELTNLRKDGSPYTVDATLTPLKNDRGEVIHYIGILQDITEKKELEQLYLRSQRLETVGFLTSGIAHDLNNILSPILMSAEMLTLSVTNPEHAKLAEIIFKSADRGGELLKQLLGFARGTSSEKQILPIAPLVKETFKMYQETFPRNIDMTLDLAADLPPVAMGPGQISQVLGNIIVNARDAMPGGGSLLLQVSTEEVKKASTEDRPYARKGSFVRIRIQDSGTGIPPEYQDKIFEPFFTSKPSGKGTGLGLATCLNIVKGHHGFIELHSNEEEGTRVDLFLPVADAPPPQTKTPVPAASATTSGEGRHLVVVDDEKAVRTIVSTALESMAYSLQSFSSGREALDYLTEHPEVDLVLLDYEMPGMNGQQVVSEMDERQLDMPVLFITGLKEESKEQHIDFRGRPVLFKPFTLDELRKAVEAHLKSETT